jgi:hypothetical protein
MLKYCVEIAKAAVENPGDRIFFHLDCSPIRGMFDKPVYYMQYYLGVTRIYKFAIPCDEVLFEIKGPPCKPASREIGLSSINFLFDLIYSNGVNEPFSSKESFSMSKIYEQFIMFPDDNGEPFSRPTALTGPAGTGKSNMLSLMGSFDSDDEFKGLFRKKPNVFFDTRKAEKIYKVNRFDLNKVTEED